MVSISLMNLNILVFYECLTYTLLIKLRINFSKSNYRTFKYVKYPENLNQHIRTIHK